MNKDDSQLKDTNDGESPSINIEGVDDRQQKDVVTLEEDFGWVVCCSILFCSTDTCAAMFKLCQGYATLSPRLNVAVSTDLSRPRGWST